MTKRKAKSNTPAAMLVALHKDVETLTHATLTLAKRIVKLEKDDKQRVVIGFADAEAYHEIASAEEVEDIENDGEIVG